MKQSFILWLRAKELYPGSEIVRMRAFKTFNTQDNCALLARANHSLAFGFAASRGESALFSEEDCFECMSPHNLAA